MNTLQKNAVLSIQAGVKDYEAKTEARLLSAVRNIYAGILLLYLEKLRRVNPNLITYKTSKGDTRTIGWKEVKNNFNKENIHTDWSRFERIRKIRHDVEHYYTTVPKGQIEKMVSEAIPIIRDFVQDELQSIPRDLLGHSTWETMLNIKEVYDKEKSECQDRLKTISWESECLENAIDSLPCSKCGHPLLWAEPLNVSFEDVALSCRRCNDIEDYDSFVPRAIAEYFEWDMYLSHTDAGEIPYVNCPECSEDTYVIGEKRCTLCGYEAEHKCVGCGTKILPEELETSPYCGYCAHVMSKDD